MNVAPVFRSHWIVTVCNNVSVLFSRFQHWRRRAVGPSDLLGSDSAQRREELQSAVKSTSAAAADAIRSKVRNDIYPGLVIYTNETWRWSYTLNTRVVRRRKGLFISMSGVMFRKRQEGNEKLKSGWNYRISCWMIYALRHCFKSWSSCCSFWSTLCWYSR